MDVQPFFRRLAALCARCRQALPPRQRVARLGYVLFLAHVVGLAVGLGSALFGMLVSGVTAGALGLATRAALADPRWWPLVAAPPALSLLAAAWLKRRFAPSGQGFGVPEVILAVTRHEGVIPPRASAVETLASGVTIGGGGSVGPEGPVVQLGAAVGSLAGQWLRLPPPQVKVLLAAGAAAGISATFNAPLAGVIFASEIILGSFAVESLTPIVIAAVLADVLQTSIGEHGAHPAFAHLRYEYLGAWQELPGFFLLGLGAGLASAWFTRLPYQVDDLAQRWLPDWRWRALACGGLLGLAGCLYPLTPPQQSPAARAAQASGKIPLPPLLGVGYGVVEHALRLESQRAPPAKADTAAAPVDAAARAAAPRQLRLPPEAMWAQLAWLLPLVFLKPLLTSVTLAGGGSGGVFAPSLVLGASLGAAFGLASNLVAPQASADPGVYAIMGMGAVLAGATHGVLSAIVMVYELTESYSVILPIMIAAGLSSVVARVLDPESIYQKKLSRRGELAPRGHEMARLEHVLVRDVMIRDFPRLRAGDSLTEILRAAQQYPRLECLPVLGDDGRLVGIIGSEELHRLQDSELPPHALNGYDIAARPPLSVSPQASLLEALRDFGAQDVETLPVEVGVGPQRRLVGLLPRAEVMRRCREEMLEDH